MKNRPFVVSEDYSYFKEIVERGPEIVVRIDENYAILYLNTSAKDFFLGTNSNVSNLRRLLTSEFPSTKLSEAKAKGCVAGEFEIIDWQQKSILASYMMLSHCGKDLTDTFSLVIKDMSGEKSTREEFLKKAEELNRFIYRVSHDLRGPISSLMGLSNLVKKEINEIKSLNYFDLYHSQVDRLNNIVTALGKHSILSLSEREPEEFTFSEILETVLTPFHKTIESAKISIDKSFPKQVFVGNKLALQTIVQSLVENSVHFRSDYRKPCITIMILDEGDFLMIKVQDNGIGIESSHHVRIFQMFYRAHSNSKGSGLGLYLFETALKKLDGFFELESEVDKGTQLAICIPYHQSNLKRK